jgi:putative nucleotidyltransferase with HDIG domain
MNTRANENEAPEKLNAFHGLLFALFCAISAELSLRTFLTNNNSLASLGRCVVLFLTLYVVHRFAGAGFRSYRPRVKDLLALAVVLLGSMFMLWLGHFLAMSIATSSFGAAYIGGVNRASWDFVIPFASGCLVLQAILGLQYGLVCGLSLSLIIGLYLPGDAVLIPYVLATSLVACLSLSRFRSRSAYLRAGLNISLVAVPFALISCIISQNLLFSDLVIRLVGAFAGGILAAFIASGVTPLFEYFGEYVTDMRLIEMATLDHPLLKELSIQSPGTWNHSMVMGMMVESAADAVGANSVVTRVGAYFHDVGKMTKPLYFVENQLQGENRHDKLSPSMSALIIRSHVKDGIELARKHALPKVIEDMIPQHHGTSIIEYFYEKARKEAEENGQDADSVDRSLYQYPGPKPQTKEAGILMLADGIEAASRTLSEPSPDRIRGLVQKMINKVFSSGELDECELTLRDLHQIAKCFSRILTGIYHQRVAYAEPAEKTNETDREKEEGEGSTSAEDLAGEPPADKSKLSSEERGSKKESKEDLKRLGL